MNDIDNVIDFDPREMDCFKPSDATFTFGKYKGQSIQTVIKKDIAYVRWALDNVDFFKLPDGVELPKRSYSYEETDGDYFANMALREDADRLMDEMNGISYFEEPDEQDFMDAGFDPLSGRFI